ncbi:hypothetical protein [Mycolicibacterium peregrinum]|uniref:hypothetical protein n=1 Tax=Mycolicibacterium peregrinum TaxID=43304 RepID=UPI003AAB3059
MTILDDIRDQLGNDVLDAADTLSSFIMDAATRTAEQVGFGYILVPDAPSTFPTLTEAYQRSVTTGEPLPISSENSDDVIYSPASVNGALRFWHDINHVRRKLDFGLVDELELSIWHLDELERAGHPPGSLVWRLLHADLTGQAYVQAFAQRFPFDQRRFVTGCVTAGFDHGLLAELRSTAAP